MPFTRLCKASELCFLYPVPSEIFDYVQDGIMDLGGWVVYVCRGVWGVRGGGGGSCINHKVDFYLSKGTSYALLHAHDTLISEPE